MERGLDGKEDDEDDDNDGSGSGHGNDDDNNGGCGGCNGHHRMRKGRGIDDRTKHNNKVDHRRGGGDGGDRSDNDDESDGGNEQYGRSRAILDATGRRHRAIICPVLPWRTPWSSILA